VKTPFTVSWWAYTFPIGAISIVYTRYAESLNADGFLKYFAFLLSLFSSFMVLMVFLNTVFRVYSADWTVNPDTGKVQNPGLFHIDPVIEICLHKLSKAIVVRSHDDKQHQIAGPTLGARDTIRYSIPGLTTKKKHRTSVTTGEQYRTSVTTGTVEHVLDVVEMGKDKKTTTQL